MDISNETQAAIAEKQLTAPRITLAAIEAEVRSEWYINGASGAMAYEGLPFAQQPPVPAGHRLELLTLCVLVLKNGMPVIGYSCPISRENYNEDIGRQAARNKALSQVGDLLAFRILDQQASA